MAKFAAQGRLKDFVSKDLLERTEAPIWFRTPQGGLAYGYEATILADLCEARGAGATWALSFNFDAIKKALDES